MNTHDGDHDRALITSEGISPLLSGFCSGLAGLVVLFVMSASARSVQAVVAVGILLVVPSLFLLSGFLISRMPGSAAFYALCFAVLPLSSVVYLFFSSGRRGVPSAAIAMCCAIVLQSLAIYAGIRAAREKRLAQAETGRACPVCGYSFAGLGAEGTCPECGRPFRRSSDLV